ncbi:uncharacterized protein LOC121378333 isoform X2 [Gigantopelta aegis]|uniref:uncharacterized protein LOC121378333 isoform X2 n=1 Tax=Gigantopelta aegis TaxID=1735272 RepID=UPI001B88CC8A|nr:uncharacterized protein LOC121378333 isoform X2 [Gigantopelta aegis]
MSGSAYHWDALRKERILQRKREALRRLQNPDPVIDNTGRTKKREEPLVIADQGEFVNLRSRKANTCTNKMQIGALDSNILGADSGVVFENVTHDPNYKYRLHRHSCLPPVHVDPIYGLIYPGSFKYTASCSCRSITMWTGTERNRRFYDHSRMGPVNDQSWRSLRRELKFREASLSYGGKGGLETYVHCDHCHFKPNYGRL